MINCDENLRLNGGVFRQNKRSDPFLYAGEDQYSIVAINSNVEISKNLTL